MVGAGRLSGQKPGAISTPYDGGRACRVAQLAAIYKPVPTLVGHQRATTTAS
jgi:hypothetical protein